MLVLPRFSFALGILLAGGAALAPAQQGGVAADRAGNVYFTSQNSVFKLGQNGILTRVAGNLQAGYSGDGGPATDAQLSIPDYLDFDYPIGLATDSAGNLYIADYGNNCVRKVSPAGIITTVAGNGAPEYLGGLPSRTDVSGDGGPATSAPLSHPQGVAVDGAGNLYIADVTSVRKVSPDEIITTVAGNGIWGCTGPNPFFVCESGDGGPATSALLVGPTGVAVDGAGNLYIADPYNGRVRKVSPAGFITTVAGDGSRGARGYSGDGVPATSALLGSPMGLAIDTAGNLYIADTFNYNIRRVSADGIITTIAAQLNFPLGLAVDCAGNLYFADDGLRVGKISPSGVITILAGPGASLPQPASSSIGCVTNGAGNLSGPVAPGEIVVITGSGLGPAQLVSAAPGGDGLYATRLAGASVQFNGTPAPLIYTSATQVAAVVPYSVADGAAQVTVTYQGQASQSQTSSPFSAQVAASAPGIFTLDSTGRGQAAALNQDRSLNTAATPAKVGDIISLYATGEGQTSPAGMDGKPASVPLPHPVLSVSVTIGGQTVTPVYAGGAPGEIAGVMQINVPIPSGIQVGSAVPVVVRVGDALSQAGVTISVQ